MNKAQQAPPQPERRDDEEARRSAQSAAISLGTQLMAGMVIFAGLGIWFDHRFETGRAGTLAGIFLGLFYGGYEVWKLVARINASEQSKSGGNGPAAR